jgi:glyoxylate/hydroxypyruvate reductase
MALLLMPSFGSAEVWRRAFAAAMPDLEVRIWPEVGDPAEIEAAAVGALPAGALGKLKNLRLIISLTAGTDALLRVADLPAVPIVRSADPAGDTG